MKLSIRMLLFTAYGVVLMLIVSIWPAHAGFYSLWYGPHCNDAALVFDNHGFKPENEKKNMEDAMKNLEGRIGRRFEKYTITKDGVMIFLRDGGKISLWLEQIDCKEALRR